MSEKHDLVLDTPFGPFTLDGEQTQQFATTIKQKLNQIPYTDAADEGSQNYIETEMMETKVQEIFEKEYPAKMECFWRYLKTNFTIEAIKNYGQMDAPIAPIFHDFELHGNVYKLPLKLIAHLKHKETGNKITIQFIPYDGLNIDLRINFDHNCKIGKEVWTNFMDFFYTNSLLKNNKFYADLSFITDPPTAMWEDVVLSEENQHTLKRNVVDFFEHMDLFKARNLKSSRGVMLAGPPGTGKTLTCNVLMNDVNVTTIVVTRDSLSETGDIAGVYEMAQKFAPTLLVFEDIDTLGGITRMAGDHPLLGEFLNALSGTESNEGVVTLATTNHANKLDWALIDRPGRFDARIDLGYPDAELRERILNKYLEKLEHDKLKLKSIVKDTEGLSGAYLEEIVRTAFVLSLEDNNYDVTKAKVTQKHLEKATQNIITQREKVKKDLATMDLELPSYDDDDGYQVVEHTLYG